MPPTLPFNTWHRFRLLDRTLSNWRLWSDDFRTWNPKASQLWGNLTLRCLVIEGQSYIALIWSLLCFVLSMRLVVLICITLLCCLCGCPACTLVGCGQLLAQNRIRSRSCLHTVENSAQYLRQTVTSSPAWVWQSLRQANRCLLINIGCPQFASPTCILVQILPMLILLLCQRLSLSKVIYLDM